MSKIKNPTTGVTKTYQSTNQAIVSINVNNQSSSCMASSFDNQCSIVKQTFQQAPITKKRAALENISNSNSSIPNMFDNLMINNSQQSNSCKSQTIQQNNNMQNNLINSNNANNNSNNNKSDQLSFTSSFKKSRFGTSVFSSTSANKQQANLSKSSKENLVNQPKTTTTTTSTNNSKNKLTLSNNNTKKNVLNTKQSKQEQNKINEQSSNELVKENDQKANDLLQVKNDTKIEHDNLNNLNEQQHQEEQELISTEQEIELTAEQIQGWEDIDLNDKDDEFSAADYVKQIFKYYRQREDKFLVNDYLKHQPHINKQMRLLLVDWMVEVQQQLEFNHEVLYLSVKLIDLYLNQRRIEKEKLQLLGGAAMFIACKFEERMPPIIDDFIYVSDNAYDRKELIKMEIEILKTVKFDIGIPLSYTFLRRYSKCIRADMRFLTLARYILELSLQDYQFAYVKDSLKACASLYLAVKMALQYEKNISQSIVESNSPDQQQQQQQQQQQLTVSVSNLTSTEWNETLIHFTGSFLKDFIHLIPLMNNLVKTAAQSRYKTIFKKYSHHVFYEVAKIAPLSDTDVELLIQNCNEKSIGSVVASQIKKN